MNTQARKPPQNQPIDEVKSSHGDNFDFELWAKEVRRQMLAALSKNGALLYPKD
ncbi:MAG: hypothetical protein ACM37W_00145 [Actinomycetota bacterium]